MRRRRWICVLVLAELIGFGMAATGLAQRAVGEASTVTLAEMRDRLRPVLIFAPEANDPRLVEQVRVIGDHAAEAADRDLVTVILAEHGSFPAGRRLADKDAAEARRRFHVRPGEFVVVLVGKDGGEKLRAGKPFSFERLREVIDAMPMRQEEMKARGQR